jgi:HD superfamily phosphodiesterase
MIAIQNITKAKQKWQNALYSYVENIFKTTWLPSHDVWHSVRVWEFAKSLILVMEKNEIPFSFKETEELMIASYFHDTGMSLTLDPVHGKHSREICHKFLKTQPSLTQHQKEKILDAIEFHDDKSYRNEIFQNQKKLLPWLCIADDLDAFGNIGIYRFWEIYNLRHFSESQMPEKIIRSLGNRINYFSDAYPFRDDFYNSQIKRSNRTADFYIRMKKEIKDSGNLKSVSFTGKIIQIFRDLILLRKIRPEQLYSFVQKEISDPEIIDFFRIYNDEDALRSL